MPNTTRKVHSPNLDHTELTSAEDASTKALSVAELMAQATVEEATYKSLSIASNLDTDQSTFKYYAADRAVDVSSRLGVALFPDSGDLAKQKVVSKASAVSRAASVQDAVKAELLLWKLKDYPVSPYHVFTSAELKQLKGQIESTLSAKGVEFEQSCKSTLVYDCVVWRSSSKVKFCVRVSKLQSSCQKTIGNQYVLEIIKDQCASAFTWRTFATELLESLKRFLAMNGPRKHRSSTFEELVDQKSFDLQSRQISRKLSLGKEDARELTRKYALDKVEVWSVLSRFLYAFESKEASPCSVEYASVFAGLSEELPSGGACAKGLDHVDVTNLVALTTSECNDLRRVACTIIRNVARSGLLQSLSDIDKEALFTALTRCINSLKHGEKFVLGLKREAVRAIAAMHGVFTPVGVSSRAAAFTALKSCVSSSDSSLSKFASEAIEAHGLNGVEATS